MGAGIQVQVQRLENEEWVDFSDEVFLCYGEQTAHPFTEQNYAVFGLLANVRNYACIPPIGKLRGLPKVEEPELCEDNGMVYGQEEWLSWPEHQGNHSATWYLVSELLAFDYDVAFENRRDEGGNRSLPKGSGVITTVRNCLGDKFFEDLSLLVKLGDPSQTRVIVSFDS